MMTEKLLQFIWQGQYFNRSSLFTRQGEAIQVVRPGTINHDQGPDFLNAQVKIGPTTLAGSVELHLKTSQWKEHGHDKDPHYRNVILHVVYENDLEEHELPVLELQPLIPSLLLERYAALMMSPGFIPCASSITAIPALTWVAWKERLLAERMLRRSEGLLLSLQQNGWHWEEAFWWLLASSFGARVNSQAFEQVARSIPLPVLARHRHQIHQLEGLLFGQAGLLSGRFSEDYPLLLQREYRFLRRKWNLQPPHVPIYFLRMRPGNFPSVRLAQLAMLIYHSSHLFSKVLETERIETMMQLFDVTANDYWHYHYRFEELTAYRPKKLGKEMIRSIMINTIIPVLFTYGIHHGEEKYRQRALDWLEKMETENNAITRGFSQIKVESRSAYDSQSLIELKTKYCDNRHCLQCAIGNALLKST